MNNLRAKITGTDLIEWGVNPSPAMGLILNIVNTKYCNHDKK